MDTTTCTDPGTLLKVGWNDAGEWQRHTVTCTPGTYNLYIRYGAPATGGQIDISLLTMNGSLVRSSNDLSGIVTLPATGDYTQYATYVVNNITITNTGLATLQSTVVSPGYDLVWLELALPARRDRRCRRRENSSWAAQSGVPAGLTAGLSAQSGNRGGFA